MALDSGQAVKIILRNVRLRVPIMGAENQYTCTYSLNSNNNRIIIIIFIIIIFRAKRPEIGENQLKLADNLGIEMPASIME